MGGGGGRGLSSRRQDVRLRCNSYCHNCVSRAEDNDGTHALEQLHGHQQRINFMAINRESIAWLSTGNQLHGYQQGIIGLKQNGAQSARTELTNKEVN